MPLLSLDSFILKNFKIRFGFQKRGRVSKSFRLQKEFFLEEILCLLCRHLTSNYLPTSTAFLIFYFISKVVGVSGIYPKVFGNAISN